MLRRGAGFLLVCVLVVVVLLPPASAPPPPPQWVQKALLPEGRGYFGIAVLNGRIYVAGGIRESVLSGQVSARVDVYHPDSDSWTRAADLRVARWGLTLVAVGNRLIAAGGSTNVSAPAGMTNVTEVYDYVTDSWAQTLRMPAPRIWAAGVAVNGTAQVWGGSVNGSGVGTSTVYAYDPGDLVAPSWSVRAAMPFAASRFQATAAGGLVIATGGWGRRTDVWAYNVTTGAWTARAPMAIGRGAHAAADLDGSVYVVGGVTANTTECAGSPSSEAYDPAADSWSNATAYPVPVAAFGAARIGTTIYGVGGTGCGVDSGGVYARIVTPTSPPVTPALDAVAVVAAFAGAAALLRWGARRRVPPSRP